jgi:Type II restriction endonuclease EcoO109I
MDAKVKKKIEKFVNENIGTFHSKRIENLKNLKLKNLLQRKNPYLFRAKNLNLSTNLITAILEAHLSSSEEGSFGGFLEKLAIYVAEVTGGGQKSAAEGIDIELIRKSIRYLIAVKSGKNWGNSGSHKNLKKNFAKAVKIIKQTDKKTSLQPTLGICYGNFKTVYTGEYLHIGGQSFWHLISGDKEFYVDLVEPLGKTAEEHDKVFKEEKDNTFNRLLREFTNDYCGPSGAINWKKLVKFVSGNL